MIDKKIVIPLYDDNLKKLLSQRGCFPINFMDKNYLSYINFVDGLPPSCSQDNYRVCDLLRTLTNLKRSNFIDLLFGISKKEIDIEQSNKLF